MDRQEYFRPYHVEPIYFEVRLECPLVRDAERSIHQSVLCMMHEERRFCLQLNPPHEMEGSNGSKPKIIENEATCGSRSNQTPAFLSFRTGGRRLVRV